MNKEYLDQTGQVIVVLLLTMLGALVVGLVITQRSINDVTTSTQSDQSSRAFSAAEAGLEKVRLIQPTDLNVSLPITESQLGNESKARAFKISALPLRGQALEYPPIGRETVAQFWLVPPTNISAGAMSKWPKDVNKSIYEDLGYLAYKDPQVYVYWGNSDLATDAKRLDLDTPAIEVDVITKNVSANSYKSYRYFFDPLTTRNNGFTTPNCKTGETDSPSGSIFPDPINTTNSRSNPLPADRQFRCRAKVPPSSFSLATDEHLFLIRARILYSSAAQAVAVRPIDVNKQLPNQVEIYTSIGTAGQSQKTIQIFHQTNVASSFFDFALFSAGSITKK
jgi:hypothetical protein